MPKFAVTITFDDLTARDEARPEHRVYLKSLLDEGKLIESGPFADDSGALLIYEADSESELHSWLAADPYATTDGVIAETVIKEWIRVFPAD